MDETQKKILVLLVALIVLAVFATRLSQNQAGKTAPSFVPTPSTAAAEAAAAKSLAYESKTASDERVFAGGSSLAFYENSTLYGGDYSDEATLENNGNASVNVTVITFAPSELTSGAYYFAAPTFTNQRQRDYLEEFLSYEPVVRAVVFELDAGEKWTNAFIARLPAKKTASVSQDALKEVFFEDGGESSINLPTDIALQYENVGETVKMVNPEYEILPAGLTQGQLDALKTELAGMRHQPTFEEVRDAVSKLFPFEQWTFGEKEEGKTYLGGIALPQEIVLTVSEQEPAATAEIPLPKNGVVLAQVEDDSNAEGGSLKECKAVSGVTRDCVSVEQRTDEEGNRFLILKTFADEDYITKQGELDLQDKIGFLKLFSSDNPVLAEIPITIKVEHTRTKAYSDVSSGRTCTPNRNAKPPTLLSAKEASDKAEYPLDDAGTDKLGERCLKEGTSLINYATKFCGKPYVLACDPPASFSCACFVTYVLGNSRNKENPKPLISGIQFTDSASGLYDEVTAPDVGLEVSADELRPGDLVFFKTYPGSDCLEITHVEFYAGDGKTIGAGDPVGFTNFEDRFEAHYACTGSKPEYCSCSEDNSKWQGKRVFRAAYRVIPSCVEYTKRLRETNA